MMDEPLRIDLSPQEKIKCLRELIKKLRKIVYVYEQSQNPDTGYDYKLYIRSLLYYVSSSNVLFNGDLINILVNLTTININELDKKEIKKIVNDTVNIAEYMLKQLEG